ARSFTKRLPQPYDDVLLTFLDCQRAVSLEELDERSRIVCVEDTGDLLVAERVAFHANLHGVVAIELRRDLSQRIPAKHQPSFTPRDDLRQIRHRARHNAA